MVIDTESEKLHDRAEIILEGSWKKQPQNYNIRAIAPLAHSISGASDKLSFAVPENGLYAAAGAEILCTICYFCLM
jgi:hypothetical protein